MARKWWTLLAVSVATFMLLLDITVVNTALPSIQKDLSASFTDLQWVIDAYTLTLAAVVLTAGSIADRIGRRVDIRRWPGDLLAGLARGGTRVRCDRPEHFEGRAGHRRRRDVCRVAGPGRPGVRGRPGASDGDGRVWRGDRRRGGRRPAGRRDGHRRAGVALGVLPQRADRHRGAGGDLRQAA